MADPTTTNRSLAIPTRGSNVGSWDTPINANFTAIDTLFGAVTVVAVSSSNVTLSTSQCQNAIIRLTGTLSANIDIIFPTVAAIYTVENLATGNYYIRCRMASGAIVGLPQGAPTQIFTDGTDTKYWNVPLPGTFWDYAGSSVPGWISNSTTPPWLICDGSAVSRTTYATLYSILGTTWGAGDGTTTFNLPDLRNKVRVAVKSSSPLITSAVSSVDGSTVGSSSTAESVTLSTSQIPTHNHNATSTVTDPGHTHPYTIPIGAYGGSGSGSVTYSASGTTGSRTTGITVSTAIENTGGGQAHTSVQPTAVHGITLIKT